MAPFAVGVATDGYATDRIAKEMRYKSLLSGQCVGGWTSPKVPFLSSKCSLRSVGQNKPLKLLNVGTPPAHHAFSF